MRMRCLRSVCVTESPAIGDNKTEKDDDCLSDIKTHHIEQCGFETSGEKVVLHERCRASLCLQIPCHLSVTRGTTDLSAGDKGRSNDHHEHYYQPIGLFHPALRLMMGALAKTSSGTNAAFPWNHSGEKYEKNYV